MGTLSLAEWMNNVTFLEREFLSKGSLLCSGLDFCIQGPRLQRLQGWGFLEGLLQGYNDSSQTEGVATSLVLRPGLDLENVELMSSFERGRSLAC